MSTFLIAFIILRRPTKSALALGVLLFSITTTLSMVIDASTSTCFQPYHHRYLVLMFFAGRIGG